MGAFAREHVLDKAERSHTCSKGLESALVETELTKGDQRGRVDHGERAPLGEMAAARTGVQGSLEKL